MPPLFFFLYPILHNKTFKNKMFFFVCETGKGFKKVDDLCADKGLGGNWVLYCWK